MKPAVSAAGLTFIVEGIDCFILMKILKKGPQAKMTFHIRSTALFNKLRFEKLPRDKMTQENIFVETSTRI